MALSLLTSHIAAPLNPRSGAFLSPILGPKAQWLVSYGEHLHSRGQVDGWNCTADEDADMSKHWRDLSRVELKDVSIGVLQLAHGLDPSFLQAANSSRACLEETFEASLPLTIATAEDITCRYKQQGTREEEECFSAFMAGKVRAARSSPYDITIMINTEVFGNPSHPMRLGMAEALKKRMVEGGIDLFVANEPSFSVYRGDFTQRMNFGLLNSGLLIFRKSPITDRFFACTENFMASPLRERKRSKMHVREAYDNLLTPHGPTLLPTLSNAALASAGLDVDCQSWCNKGAKAWAHTCTFASCRSCRQCLQLPASTPAEPSMRSVTSRVLPPEWTCRLQPLQPDPMYLQPDAPTDVGDASVPCIFVHSVRWPPSAEPGKCPLSLGAGGAGAQKEQPATAQQGQEGASEADTASTIAAAKVSEREHPAAAMKETGPPATEVDNAPPSMRLKLHGKNDAVAVAEAESVAAAEGTVSNDADANAEEAEADAAAATEAREDAVALAKAEAEAVAAEELAAKAEAESIAADEATANAAQAVILAAENDIIKETARPIGESAATAFLVNQAPREEKEAEQ